MKIKSAKFTSTISGATIFISIVMLIGKAFGFLREVIFANYYGIGEDFDLFLISAVFPMTFNTIIFFMGQNFFIPIYNKIVTEEPANTSRLISQILTMFIFSGFAFSIIIFLLSDFIFDLYLYSASEQLKSTASIIFKILILSIPFSAGVAIFSSYLNAKFEFKYPAISHLFLNGTVILAILLFSNTIGIYIIPIGYTLGTLFQFIFLLRKAWMYNEFSLNKLKLSLNFIKKIGNTSIIIIILIESIGQLYMIVDRFFYNEVETGGIASLNYALILYQFPISIFSFAISSAIFPRISKEFSEKAYEKLNTIVDESIRIIVIIFLPVSIIFFVFGDFLIQIIYEHGNFSSEGTRMTFDILRFLSLSLVFYTVYSILNKIFYSIDKVKVLLFITIAGIFLKFLFNLFFVPLFSQNGLALSTTLSYLFFFSASYLFLKYKLKLLTSDIFITELILNFING